MKELHFTTDIRATQQKVWDTLWQDATLREWAGVIDPGTYMRGELVEGGTIEFISAENGYGVTSLVAKVVPGEYLLLKHQADTKQSGEAKRDDQWTGGNETYSLTSKDDVTTLTATFDTPAELEEYFHDAYPKALAKVKEIAERS